MAINKLKIKPVMVSAAAIYPYAEDLHEMGARESRFGEPYNLFRVVGTGKAQRIWVPRNMAPSGVPTDFAEGMDCQFKSLFVPRNDEQTRVISETVQLLAQGENFIVECPTGFGKTACSMDIIAKVGKKTLVVVTKEDIRDQWVDAAKKFLGLTDRDIGFIQADKFQVPGKKLVIAMIQSLAKEDRYPAHAMKEFGLAIWDESGSPDTLVTTRDGQMRFEDLVAAKYTGDVLSLNVETGGYEWKPILAHHKHQPKNPMMRITHEHGYLDFTSEHLILTQRGWVKAVELVRGDCLEIDFTHSIRYNNHILTEGVQDGSMVDGVSAGRFECSASEWEGKSEGTPFGGTVRLSAGEVREAFWGGTHTPSGSGESGVGHQLHLLRHSDAGGFRSVLEGILFRIWAQDTSAIACNTQMAGVAGVVGNGRWGAEYGVHRTPVESLPSFGRSRADGVVQQFWINWFGAESQGLVYSVLSGIQSAAQRATQALLRSVHAVQAGWGAFWRKGRAVQGVRRGHPNEGWGEENPRVLPEGSVSKGEAYDVLPTPTQGSVRGGKAQGSSLGGKTRVLSVERIETPEWVYDIEVSDNHNFVANGVVVHNCHRVAADYFSQSCYRVPAKLRLGLSATPDRKDGKEEAIHSHIGLVQVKTEAAPMTPRVIARRSPWTIPMTRVKQKNGTVKVGPIPHSPGKCGHVINMLANHHARNDMLARFVSAAFKKGRNILVQSDRKEHLETLAMMIQKQGVPPAEIGYYLGGMTAAQRDYAKGKSVIMATYQMTAEATDIPWLDTLVMATPKSDVRQIVGRIIRQYEGKQEPVVFDLIDSSSNVFQGYWNTRSAWYKSIGAEVGTVPSGTSQT